VTVLHLAGTAHTRAVFSHPHIGTANSGREPVSYDSSNSRGENASKRLTSGINSRLCRSCSGQHLTNGVEILFYRPVRSVDHEIFAVQWMIFPVHYFFPSWQPQSGNVSGS